jgi:predicted nucleotidyltransferase component of viral defense system
MNGIPNKNILDEVALELSIDGAFVEKDWYVTQAIQLISNLISEDFKMVFTGGTALSKAHKLLHRFSEDIDFRVIPLTLDKSSKTKQRIRLSNLKKEIVTLLKVRFDIPDENVTARNENRFFSIAFEYPTVYARARALRPHVLVEFTVSSLVLPEIKCPVSSFVNELSGKAPEVEAISCIDPVENASDKLSALVWRTADRVRGSENDDPAIVRHMHDLAILHDLVIKHSRFPQLARQAIEQDDKRSKKIAGLPLEEKLFRVLNTIANDQAYAREYVQFVQGMSYAKTEQMPSFKDVLTRVESIAKSVMGSEGS